MTLHAQEQTLDDDSPPNATHLADSRAALRRMRERAEALFATGDKVAGDAYAAETLGRTLARRVAELADDPTTPLFFGRLDFGDADADHAGQRTTSAGGTSPTTPASRWCSTGGRRSPASFYRASAARPAGRRRPAPVRLQRAAS